MALRLYENDKQDDDDMFTQQLRACDKALNEFECIKRKARCALLHWGISWEILRQATATGETVYRLGAFGLQSSFPLGKHSNSRVVFVMPVLLTEAIQTQKEKR